jgi:hypothetical protein
MFMGTQLLVASPQRQLLWVNPLNLNCRFAACVFSSFKNKTRMIF